MKSSYRQVLRSSSIIGGASVVNVLLGLVRMKAAAVLLGPAGVGLIGVFSNLVGVAISLASLGLGNAGTRQIAAADGNPDAARRALFWMSVIMAVAGAGLFWALRGLLAKYVLGDIGQTANVGWLAVAVGLSILAGAQEAMLNGMRRVGDLSRLSVYAAFWSSVLGIAALWTWGIAGVVFYIIAVPFVGVLLGYWYVAKLPEIAGHGAPIAAVVAQGREMLKLGAAFMLTSSIGYSGLLLVRSLVQNELGIEALGFFQASSAISLTYIGFVIAALGRDYFPRLAGVIGDDREVNKMVNEQTEISLLLAGPVFLMTMATAPWLISLLYSSAFGPAAAVLHWQIIGDVLKVAGWPISYILVAAGDGRAFVKNEIIGFAVFGLLAWLLLPLFGIAGSGMAYLGMMAVGLARVFWQARKRTGFSWLPEVVKPLIFLVLASAGLLLLSSLSAAASAVSGLVLSAAFAIYGFSRLAHKTGLTGRLGVLAASAQKGMKKLGLWHD